MPSLILGRIAFLAANFVDQDVPDGVILTTANTVGEDERRGVGTVDIEAVICEVQPDERSESTPGVTRSACWRYS